MTEITHGRETAGFGSRAFAAERDFMICPVKGCADRETPSADGSKMKERFGHTVITLGSNVHIFARPHRGEALARCFEVVLGSQVRTVEFPGLARPMLLVSFPGGGHLSIEFTDDAPDEAQPRLGAWLELRADDPASAHRTALDAGLAEVKHAGHPYYFMIPGGQIFAVARSSAT